MASAADHPFTLSYRHVFGLKANVRHNLHYADETSVLYPAGHATVLYNVDQRTQRFFPGTDGTEEISCLCTSHNKRYMAVAERSKASSSDRPVISVYDLQIGRKRKTFTYPDIDCTEIVSMAFDAQNKYLLTQYGVRQ